MCGNYSCVFATEDGVCESTGTFCVKEECDCYEKCSSCVDVKDCSDE